MRAYVYLALPSQIQATSSIMGNLLRTVDAQQVFHSTFTVLINEDYSYDTDFDRYQSVLENALSKVYFSIRNGIYIL